MRLIKLLTFQLILMLKFSNAVEKVRVAVVGAGISGASVTHFLRSHKSAQFQVDVFEKASKAGGRLALADIDGHFYESGGSIIHPRNRYMQEFVKILALKKRDSFKQLDAGRFAIFDGQKMLFQESKYNLFTILKMFYRYGLDPIRMKGNVDSTLTRFDQIYDLLDHGNLSFKTVKDLLKNTDSGLYADSMKSFQQTELAQKFKKPFIDEIFGSILRTNYGQSLEMAGFAGSVAVAGAGSELWSVHGGNRLIVEGLLNRSESTLHFNTEINKISKKDEKFYLDGTGSVFGPFDSVVLAMPISEKLNFENLGLKLAFPKFHKLHVTFLSGQLKPKFSHLSAMLFCGSNEPKINSIGLNMPVDSAKTEEKIYKIFTNQPLNVKDLDEFFLNFTLKYETVWLAYPEYEKEYRLAERASFELTDRLYYVNAIESAASAMEMSCIGGRNVANLVYNKFYEDSVGKVGEKVMKHEL